MMEHSVSELDGGIDHRSALRPFTDPRTGLSTTDRTGRRRRCPGTRDSSRLLPGVRLEGWIQMVLVEHGGSRHR
ncbi:hypothetical protein C486_07638 [Natrinema gari JCM 14663]|uniref:Uncharacterized protein n=1 Tax=Natrinema gari JCM 14663 TaxID=1230459 RepID=L9Z3L3_9EURY|nr:hypothetical protein C486_07638 [Natrinema gari JCM 14663]